MNDKEFAAMLSLLDDPDKEVRQMIESRIQGLGSGVLPRITAFADELPAASPLQSRLITLIHTLKREDFARELLAWGRQHAPGLLQGWLLLSQLLLPETEPQLVERELKRLANRAWLEIRAGMSLPEKLVILNRLIFRHEMFRAETEELRPDFLLLPQLLEQHSGTPHSLCMLHTLLCAELNLPGGTILLPDYAVALVQDHRQAIFIDVFNKGAFFVRADLQRFLRENNIEEHEQYFEASPVVTLVQELMQTLAAIYGESGEYPLAASLRDLAQQLGEE